MSVDKKPADQIAVPIVDGTTKTSLNNELPTPEWEDSEEFRAAKEKLEALHAKSGDGSLGDDADPFRHTSDVEDRVAYINAQRSARLNDYWESSENEKVGKVSERRLGVEEPDQGTDLDDQTDAETVAQEQIGQPVSVAPEENVQLIEEAVAQNAQEIEEPQLSKERIITQKATTPPGRK